MALLWFVILVVLVSLNKYIIQKLMAKQRHLSARMTATITCLCVRIGLSFNKITDATCH